MRLPGKRLHDAHTIDVLCKDRVGPRDRRADFTIVASRCPTKKNGCNDHQRQYSKREEGKAQIKCEHGDEYADDRKQITDNGKSSPANKFTQGTYIIDDACDDAPHAIAIVETQ